MPRENQRMAGFPLRFERADYIGGIHLGIQKIQDVAVTEEVQVKDDAVENRKEDRCGR